MRVPALVNRTALRYVTRLLNDVEMQMSRIAPNEVWALHPNTSFQPLGDGEGGVLLDTVSGQLFTCNDTTAAFLATVDGERSFGAILAELGDVFDVDVDVLRDDMSDLAKQLEAEGLIVRAAQ